MFTQAGQCMIKLGKVEFSEPKFAQGPSDFDICIECTHVDDANQVDWWRGEMSQNYGKGNFSTMTQTEITMQTLRKIGFEGDDLTAMEEQFTCCEPVPAMIKAHPSKNDPEKMFYNIQYLGGGGGGNAPEADKVLSKDAMKKRMAALVGGTPAATPATAAAATPAADALPDEPNPFV